MPDTTKEEKKYQRHKRLTGVAIDPYLKADQQPGRRIHSEVRGYKAPSTVYTRQYFDKKCPFTGDVRVTGRTFKAKVKKMNAEKTIVVVAYYLHYVSKYKRFQRRHTNFSVHMSPCFDGIVNVSDTVVCGETRPLSKTKSSVVLSVVKSAAAGMFKHFDGI